MTSSHPLLTALTMSLVLGSACTPSSGAARQPTTSGDSAAEAPRAPATPPPRTAQEDVEESSPPVVQDVTPPPVVARPVVVPASGGPYGVRIVDDASHNLPTYSKGGRTYVMGTVGSRYSIVLTNPTYQRVEAVVSVDGLDAMDGKPANYAEKRGYILDPYGSATIEGFRTSYEQVATFRFSSVADSYAGRLGQARDVGVIGVAFFPERPPPAPPPPPPEPYYYPRPSAMRHAPAPSSNDTSPPTSGPAAPVSPSQAGGPSLDGLASQGRAAGADVRRESARSRPGLGTEFGEARDSRISTTAFERANSSTPSEVVAIRYNDRAGLLALGIRLAPVYPTADLSLRETAEPFRNNGFAQPPP
jgi:hypothetical protein